MEVSLVNPSHDRKVEVTKLCLDAPDDRTGILTVSLWGPDGNCVAHFDVNCEHLYIGEETYL